jgi:hypothetical protein
MASWFAGYSANGLQHGRRKRNIADRYANTNIMRPVSLRGIEQRSSNFLKLCEAAGERSMDVFVAGPLSNGIRDTGF